MTIAIERISKTSLPKLLDLFSLSVGYKVSLDDEIEYFDELQPNDWFFARDANEIPIGYIRFFPQDSKWSAGEIYVADGEESRRFIAERLLEQFLGNSKYPAGYRVRFEILAIDSELVETLESFCDQRQLFRYFEMTLSQSKVCRKVGVLPSSDDLPAVSEILSTLGSFSEGDVLRCQKSIRIIKAEGSVVAATLLQEVDQAIEVVRIVTHPSFRRKGYARSLIVSICDEFFSLGKQRGFLKVNSEQLEAIKLYESTGFENIKDKEQAWYSKLF